MGVRTWMRGGGVVVGAAVLAVGVASVPAGAADQWRPRPGTLYISDLPKTESWRAAPVSRGWGAAYDCLAGWPQERPEVNVWNRDFTTAETAFAQQKVVAFATEAEAIAFAAATRQRYADCPNRPQEPGVTATGFDHGVVDVEEGATLQGMRTFNANAHERPDFNYLWGVGRDGDTVTLVLWSSYWGDPPVAAWKNTLRTAVNKLY
ncbi:MULTISPECIES: hypothetical protein [unclassified Streptomyces]|uniref:hypothetical protein n=1 Tax=unclassified Streptomyces TaxID=2593676 RepID=UPI0013A6AC67|nr:MULTISPECIES: hypothetical protein [unclassified Streptomyces]